MADQEDALAYSVSGAVVLHQPQRRDVPPWVAEMIAAAYRDNPDGIAAAVSHMSEVEQRELHRALKLLIGALVNRRLSASARKRITAEVIT
jgi:hypothetical protein